MPFLSLKFTVLAAIGSTEVQINEKTVIYCFKNVPGIFPAPQKTKEFEENKKYFFAVKCSMVVEINRHRKLCHFYHK